MICGQIGVIMKTITKVSPVIDMFLNLYMLRQSVIHNFNPNVMYVNPEDWHAAINEFKNNSYKCVLGSDEPNRFMGMKIVPTHIVPRHDAIFTKEDIPKMKSLDVGELHKAIDTLKGIVTVVEDHDKRLSTLHNRIYAVEQGNKVLDNIMPDPPEASEPPVKLIVPDDITYPSSRIGINIPYLEFGDDIVSHEAWGKLSLAKNSAKRKKLENLFRVTRDEGFGIVRFWLFPSFWHNNGVYTDAMIKEAVSSVDTLGNMARAIGIKLIPTVLSFNNYDKEKIDQHGAVEPYANATHSMLLRAVARTLANFSDVIEYVDLMNEPEWMARDILKDEAHDGAIDSKRLGDTLDATNKIFQGMGLKTGIGWASLKWRGEVPHDTPLNVFDYHAYEWSIKWFPPLEALGRDLYMGETHEPFSTWGKYLAQNKYKAVLLWLEKAEYRDAATLKARLKAFKSV